MKKNIRNFCIIAHIDHGKSTLADRLLEFTNTIQVTEGQMLDDMDLEKERGITIKSHAIQMEYVYKGEKYILNLIDTPGHVDFSYEVSRSIAACEGALLIVDASQGVQAQTISNLYMAIEHDLEIIPVINKCDMASAMPEEVEDELVELLGCKREEIIRASGKTGMGVEEILEAVVERIPHPEGDEEAPLQALIFDSVFNSFRGIIAYFKIVNGVIRKGDKGCCTCRLVSFTESYAYFILRKSSRVSKQNIISDGLSSIFPEETFVISVRNVIDVIVLVSGHISSDRCFCIRS